MIIIDTPPSLGLLTVNALVSSDWVLVPIQCEFFALEGVGQLLKTVNLVKKYLNGNLDVLGFLLTMYDRRTRLSQEVEAELRAYFRDKSSEQLYREVLEWRKLQVTAKAFWNTTGVLRQQRHIMT